MTQYLPPNLLALFAPREPIPFFAPLDKLSWEKKPWPYSGVSQYLREFEVGTFIFRNYGISTGSLGLASF